MPKLNNAKNANVQKTGRVLADVSNAAKSVPTSGATVTPINGRLTAWTDADTKSTTVNADTKTVNVVRAVRLTENGPQYRMEHTFDFSDATFAEIAELATSTLVIDVQREIRAAKNEPNALDRARWNRTTNVHDRVNRARATATRDPFANANKALATLQAADPAAYAALIAAVNAKK